MISPAPERFGLVSALFAISIRRACRPHQFETVVSCVHTLRNRRIPCRVSEPTPLFLDLEESMAFVPLVGCGLPAPSRRARAVAGRGPRRPACARRPAVRCAADPPAVEGEVDLGDAFESSLSASWEKLEYFGNEGHLMVDEEEEAREAEEEEEERRKDEIVRREAEYEWVQVDEVEGSGLEDVGDVGPLEDDVAPPEGLFAEPGKKFIRVRKTTGDDGDAEAETRTMAEIHAAEVWDENPQWFFVQVKPGCEKSCSISIRNMANSLKHINIQEVLVPTIETMRLTKTGKSKKNEEKMFPGYILVYMVMDRLSYNDVKQVTNIQWFMNDPNREKAKDAPFRPPIPVSVDEMRNVFEKINLAESGTADVKTDFRPGDLVRIVSGTHMESEGTVLEVKPDLDAITVTLVVFGRETAVDLQLDQVTLVTSAKVLNPPKKRGRKSKADLEALAVKEAAEDVPTPVMIPAAVGADEHPDDSLFDAGDDDHDGFEEAQST